MISATVSLVIALFIMGIFWWGAEREVRHLRDEVLRITKMLDVSEDDGDEALAAGQSIEVKVGQLYVKAEFIGVSMDGTRVIARTGNSAFTVDPKDVYEAELDEEPARTYRDAARRHDVN